MTEETDFNSSQFRLGPVFHVNVNCKNLNVSQRFYRDAMSLHPLLETESEANDVATFGWVGSLCHGWMFSDTRRWQSPLLDVIEWKSPSLIESPTWAFNGLGLNRLLIEGPDTGEYGGRDNGEEEPASEEPGVMSGRRHLIRDPEGVAVEFTPAEGSRFTGVAINCRDLEHAAEFYGSTLSLAQISEIEEHADTVLDASGSGEVVHEWRSCDFADARGDRPFVIRLVQWVDPEPTGSALRVANNTGLCRMAFITYDMSRDYEYLSALPIDFLGPPELLEMGPGRRPLPCVFFRDPDGTLLELIEIGLPPKKQAQSA